MAVYFPSKGTDEEKIKKELGQLLEEELKVRYSPRALRHYSTKPHPLALETVSSFMKINWNNIGMHTAPELSPKLTRKFEREVVFMVGDLFGLSDVDGYIAQGGTEGNIAGLWIGRNMLRAIDAKNREICLLKTPLCHHSIDKAADLLNISKIIDVGLDENYGMSADKLEETLENLTSQGYKNFIILLTLGYNLTGTIDPLDEIDKVVREAEEKLKIKTYVHLDAAIGGFVYPFVSKKPLDFRCASLQSISVDMHKTGLMPMTASVFLCRRGLPKWIEFPAPYLATRKVSNTISGSRPGAVAAGCWGIINLLGREGFKKNAEYCLDMKNYLFSLLEKSGSVLHPVIFSHPDMTVAAFIFEAFPKGIIPRELERKYYLVRTIIPIERYRHIYAYPLVFMPHLKKEALEEFVEDLKAEIKFDENRNSKP